MEMIPRHRGRTRQHDLEMTTETGHQPPPRSQLCIRFRHLGQSRTGCAWIDRPLHLQRNRKGARRGGATGGDARSRGRGGPEERLVNHLGMGPGVEREEGVLDGADHLLRRRRPQPRCHAEEEGHLALGSVIFPCRLAGRQTAATGAQ